jgi:hypothetical protein
MTTVISVRGRDRAELRADPNFVYVGRAVPRVGWSNSDFGNPFVLSRWPKRGVSLFERCLLAGMKQGTYPEEMLCLSWRFRPLTYWMPMANALPLLRGKVLGCWCGEWRPGEPEIACHAVVLAKLADALEWREAPGGDAP